VENVGFIEDGRILVLVGAVTLPERSRAAAARALLQFDLEQSLLIDSISLPRDAFARGFAVDPVTRRAYLLQDDGAGNGTLQVVSLYGGNRRPAVPVGAIPSGVGRRGLALARSGRMVYCLVGGESSRSDFEPVSPEPPAGPELLLLDPDTLGVTGRVPLDADSNPIAVIADPDRDRAFVLTARGRGSRLLIVDTGFAEMREEITLPNQGSDLGMAAGMVVVVTARGVYVVDPDRELVVGGTALPFERTGEIAVSPDGTRAFVQFGATSTGTGPGVALTVLPTGGLVDVLQ
jgi:DNA-binding beta-propeller fold protein YncE